MSMNDNEKRPWPPLTRVGALTADWTRDEWADAAEVLAMLPDVPAILRSPRARALVRSWTPDEREDGAAIVAALRAPPAQPMPAPMLNTTRARALVAAWDDDDWTDAASLLEGMTPTPIPLAPDVVRFHDAVHARIAVMLGESPPPSAEPTPPPETYDTARVRRMSRAELEQALVATSRHMEPAVLAEATEDELRLRLKGRGVPSPVSR